MPIKVTWKSLTGLLMALGGVAAQAGTPQGISSTHPSSYAVALTVVGALILAVERVVDAIDNKTSLSAKIAGVEQAVKPVAGLGVDVEQAKADAQAAIARFESLVKSHEQPSAPAPPAS